jgi:phage host-nuclease inhibitor protein Gam
VAKTPAAAKKAVTYHVPQTREEADRMLGEMGTLQQQLKRIEADMNDAIAPIKATFEAKAGPLNSRIEELFQGVHAWAEANRARELVGDTKTIRLPMGEIAWRLTPWKVTVRKVDEIVALLRSSRRAAWKAFIREKHELNKEAMLESVESRAEAEKIPGISITRQEECAVKPFSSDIERVEAKAVSLQEAA